MKISKRSWHYRFLNEYAMPCPDDSCGYMRSLLLGLLLTPLIAIAKVLAYLVVKFVPVPQQTTLKTRSQPQREPAKNNPRCPPVEFID